MNARRWQNFIFGWNLFNANTRDGECARTLWMTGILVFRNLLSACTYSQRTCPSVNLWDFNHEKKVFCSLVSLGASSLLSPAAGPAAAGPRHLAQRWKHVSRSALSSVTRPDRSTAINCTAGPVMARLRWHDRHPETRSREICHKHSSHTPAHFHYWFISRGLASSISRDHFLSDFKGKPGLVSSGHKNMECVWFGYA